MLIEIIGQTAAQICTNTEDGQEPGCNRREKHLSEDGIGTLVKGNIVLRALTGKPPLAASLPIYWVSRLQVPLNKSAISLQRFQPKITGDLIAVNELLGR